jgi:hypothetical protein
MLKMVLAMMRKSVRKKAGFDINSVAPIDLVPSSVIPAVFGHGTEDSFISLYHSGGVEHRLVVFTQRNCLRFNGHFLDSSADGGSVLAWLLRKMHPC